MPNEDCKEFGIPSATTYSPPCEWDSEVVDARHVGKSMAKTLGLFQTSVLPVPPDKNAELAELCYLSALMVLRPACEREINQEKSDAYLKLCKVVEHHRRVELPLLRAFALDCFKTFASVVMVEKARFNRARPVQVDKSFAPMFCVGHPAYPSGHATQSHLVALAISMVVKDPAIQSEVFSLAHMISFRREIAGVHFPSDSRAGMILAQHILARLISNEQADFVNGLKAATEEYSKCPVFDEGRRDA